MRRTRSGLWIPASGLSDVRSGVRSAYLRLPPHIRRRLRDQRGQFIVRVIPGSPPSPPDPSATLWVDGVNGSDANNIAAIRAGGGTVQWQTIYRAAQGCPPGGTPDGNQAAIAGDNVSVAGGTYSSTAVVGARDAVLYTPINEGTLGNPIRFMANGVVVLEARTLNGPVIGSNGVDYVWWTANRSLGYKWKITNGYVAGGTSAVGTVNITPDTGSVVLWGVVGCRLEGIEVDGGGGWFESNCNLIRLESCIDCTVRNCTLYNNHWLSDADSSGIHMYGGYGNVLEHLLIYDINTGIRLKDTGFTIFPMTNEIRYNWIDQYYNNGLSVSLFPQESTNRFFQNLITNGGTPSFAIGISGEESKDWFYNNTGWNIWGAVLPGPGVGARVWNNNFHTLVHAIFTDGGAGPPLSAINFQHNDYYNYSSDFFDCVGSTPSQQTFAQWKANFTGQDVAEAASITDDPLFVTPGSDFHLQGSSPCLTLGRDVDTGAIIPAGCYITGTETIGPEN